MARLRWGSVCRFSKRLDGVSRSTRPAEFPVMRVAANRARFFSFVMIVHLRGSGRAGVRDLRLSCAAETHCCVEFWDGEPDLEPRAGLPATNARTLCLLKRQLRPTLLPGMAPCSANRYTVFTWIFSSWATSVGVMISSTMYLCIGCSFLGVSLLAELPIGRCGRIKHAMA